jgi:hypothetical protein
MEVCQSGFHDQELQKKLVKVPVEGGQNVILCDFCFAISVCLEFWRLSNREEI